MFLFIFASNLEAPNPQLCLIDTAVALTHPAAAALSGTEDEVKEACEAFTLIVISTDGSKITGVKHLPARLVLGNSTLLEVASCVIGNTSDKNIYLLMQSTFFPHKAATSIVKMNPVEGRQNAFEVDFSSRDGVIAEVSPSKDILFSMINVHALAEWEESEECEEEETFSEEDEESEGLKQD